jgi:hypothetical protein
MPAPPAPLPSEAEVAQMYAVLQRYATAKDELVRVSGLAICSRAADEWWWWQRRAREAVRVGLATAADLEAASMRCKVLREAVLSTQAAAAAMLDSREVQ